MILTPTDNKMNIMLFQDQNDFKKLTYDLVTEQLIKNGHLYLRNTGITEPEHFKTIESILVKNSMGYKGGASKRSELGSGILNVGLEPGFLDLAFHNEMVYQNKFPSRLIFCCFIPSKEGGITKLTDNRKISQQIPKNIFDKLDNQGVIYYRYNFGKNSNVQGIHEGKLWQNIFQTEDKQQAEEQIKKLNLKDLKIIWGENDIFQCSYRLKIIGIHPLTKEKLLLNQAINAHFWYKEWPPYDKFDKEQLPWYSTWGDGTPFTQEELKMFDDIFEQYKIEEPWQTGDVMIIDNLLFQHGRTKYSGERKIGVMMGDPVNWEGEYVEL